MKLRQFPLALLVVFGALITSAQESEYRETVDVSLVLVDAVVVDSDGNQILGLGPDDFIITEEGVPQEIESVEYFSNRRSLDDPALERSLNLNRDQTNRYFILFFDKGEGVMQSSPLRNQLLRAVRDAQRFVDEELAEGDLVAVAGFDARLEIYSDFTDDTEQLRGAIQEALRFGTGITKAPDSQPSILANVDLDTLIRDTGRIYDALGLLGESLQQVSGRKVLVLFTAGFGSGPTGYEDDIWFDPMIEALNQSNTSVYVMNLLQGIPVNPLENTVARLADETGGDFFRRPISYGKPLRSVEKLNNGYYLLSYKPTHPAGESGYQKIDVRLRNPEFRITARDGYSY